MRTLDNTQTTATCSGRLSETAVDHLGHFTCSSPACPVMAPHHEEYTLDPERARRVRDGHPWAAAT